MAPPPRRAGRTTGASRPRGRHGLAALRVRHWTPGPSPDRLIYRPLWTVLPVARSLGLFAYGESELDPAVHAEILLESARSEARVAILIIAVAIGFALYYNFKGGIVAATSLFALITVAPLLLDS